MTFKECIKEGWQVKEGPLKRYQAVDINYIDSNGYVSEVQFNICGACTKSGEKELESLFKQFCKDEGISRNTITSITVTAVADTIEELNELTR